MMSIAKNITKTGSQRGQGSPDTDTPSGQKQRSPKKETRPEDSLKVLLVLDHAPDYRESFLRELSGYVDLTVVAQPCAMDGLTPPGQRKGYTYVELPAGTLAGLRRQPGLRSLINSGTYDILCVDFNLRHVTRLALFLQNKPLRSRWIWRGQIFGRRLNRVFDAIRHFFISRSAGCLVYTEPIAEEAASAFGVPVASFNNTQCRKEDFRTSKFPESGPVRLLFVGRWQPRKQLDRLVELAVRRKDVAVRLIGPGMENVAIPDEVQAEKRVEIYGKTSGKDLDAHFDWADLVANPGHIGLLAMNAAQHGKGIVVDSGSIHAPEYWLAVEAEQPFIDFTDVAEVDQLLDEITGNRDICRIWGERLQKTAMEKYTVENMAAAHVDACKRVHTGL